MATIGERLAKLEDRYSSAPAVVLSATQRDALTRQARQDGRAAALLHIETDPQKRAATAAFLRADD